VNVVLLSNPDLAGKIDSLQEVIRNSLAQFNSLLQSEEPTEVLASLLYCRISASILSLKVLLSGNELAESIEQLIEFN